MPDRTGRALGSLNPVIYFENAAGHLLLPPEEIGQGPAEAHRLYDQRYRSQGYQWREAGTLNDVQRLQKRLTDQEMRLREHQAEVDENAREQVHRETAARLRARMTSADCKPFERDFIRYWLEMQEEKRTKYTQRWREYNDYIWALEQDSGTKVEDRMGA
jgi:hypothetical protein